MLSIYIDSMEREGIDIVSSGMVDGCIFHYNSLLQRAELLQASKERMCYSEENNMKCTPEDCFLYNYLLLYYFFIIIRRLLYVLNFSGLVSLCCWLLVEYYPLHCV